MTIVDALDVIEGINKFCMRGVHAREQKYPPVSPAFLHSLCNTGVPRSYEIAPPS